MTDEETKEQEANASTGESFADLLEASYEEPEQYEPGQQVTVPVIRIGREWVFINLGGKSEGYIAKGEFADQEGNVSVKEGDRVEAYFLSAQKGGMLFTTKLGKGSEANAHLEEAFRSGIPVEGTIDKEVKGGYQVKVGGSVRAFCPFSQLGIPKEEDADLSGTTLSFLIIEYKENGRNIILSHRKILEEEKQRKMEEWREKLQEGMTVTGQITSLQKFGAFVDIGGIEGLIPISEVCWGHIEDISERLSVGQTVEVAVMKLDWENNRFAFSLKNTQPDPWDSVETTFPVGSTHQGRVSRLAGFGAFVTLAEGIDGLIHISALARGKRLNHPREVISEGQELEVKIESVQGEERRIGLSPVQDLTPPGQKTELQNAEDEALESRKQYEEFKKSRKESGRPSMGTLGDLLAQKLKK